MRKIIKKIKRELSIRIGLLIIRCALCKGRLRRTRQSYYGVVEINNNIGGSDKQKYELCNLCYDIYKKISKINP